jgi:cation:H+ antiporter
MMYVLLIFGLLLLVVAGEFLVKGAVGVSILLKLSPLVIGMTVVSFGTSMPELLVSLNGALDGNSGIAIGNVVGSNIVNVAFILGLSVIILPILPDKQTLKIDYPVMVAASLIYMIFALDYYIARWEGIVLFLILIIFVYRMVAKSRKDEKVRSEANKDNEQEDVKTIPVWKSLTFVALGLIGLFFGAEWFVDGAIQIAASFGLSDAIIGVTVVAVGTSMPELIASVIAAVRKQADISIGNIIGSNIFNIFGVLGLTAIIHPIGVGKESVTFDGVWMVVVALLLFPMMYIGKALGRISGVILVVSYFVYIGWMILKIKGIL